MEGSKLIVISIPLQRLFLLEGGKVKASFPVSTSKFGVGSEENSFKTPLGLHRISEKIGKGVPVGTVFVGRKPSADPPHPDAITSRILRLEGLEEGVNRGGNVDTLSRLIYIHGTSSPVGVPLSKGCIRMSDKDITKLFEMVDEGNFVLILNAEKLWFL